MEFLGFLAILIVAGILLFKPALEKLAFSIFVGAWLVEIAMFAAHTSTLLPNMNL
ncbi:Proton-translocating Cytochrome Oxidase [Helicobacter sp. NHP19-012]|uniref:Proton-translocating Cytochrome Oxidase n=1 Tax=Helicobacter gastrofelis TaxID=2849642 RepID=A0ABM7SPE5_9HELI|nr:MULTISPECIES: hypothetical protein [unclassified Helicobacter]BCZ19953.1 Proton-translocating Cytochrome Oxidase [Helicobacter sp. NHP19-012]GMB95618.1 Proton-translocating Cytochrome Oxidase [Helicobacter sp. NHP22-001]